MNNFFRLIIILFSINFSIAQVNVDWEADPVPLLSIEVVFPVGTLDVATKQSNYHVNLLSHILRSGTIDLNKEKFNEGLGDFGASLGTSFSEFSSSVTFSFPVSDGENYQPLFDLIKKWWSSPRFIAAESELAKTKIKASIKSQLDSDPKLQLAFLKKYLRKNLFGLDNFKYSQVDSLKLELAKTFFETKIKSSTKAWVGVIGPKNSKALVEGFLKAIFGEQATINYQITKDKIINNKVKLVTDKLTEKLFINIDKPDRAQIITTVAAISPSKYNINNYVQRDFADSLYFSGGFNAVFFDEIREKKGLAYYVQSVWDRMYDQNMISLIFNPQASRIDEAFEVLTKLLVPAFKTGETVKNFKQPRWEKFWQGFVNSALMSDGTAMARLAKRKAVVLGQNSYKNINSDPMKWSTDRKKVSDYYVNIWKNSSKFILTLGNFKETKKLQSKFFADYKVINIPFKDVVEYD